MLSLNSRLSTVGISSNKVVDLVMQRDQLKATLPTAGKAESASAADDQQVPKAEATKPAVAKPSLTAEQLRQVRELERIDRAVRAHEQAHLAAGRGVVTSGASFTYTQGPDGRQYAVGGEVGIDTSPERAPEANIDKGRRIQVAALAPRDPSPQDYQVAAVGGRLEGQGRTDLVRQVQEERTVAEAAARAQHDRSSGETAVAAAAADAVSQQAAAADARVHNAYQPPDAPGGAVDIFA